MAVTMARKVVKVIVPVAHKEFDPQIVFRTFDELRKPNPLKKMTDADKKIVWGMLLIFADEKFEKSKRSRYLDQIERVTKTATEAAKLANQIREILEKDNGEWLNQRLKACWDLPARLDSFAEQAGGPLRSLGRTEGKRKRAIADRYLIYASEFVKLKTGSWNDEHLFELLQATRINDVKFSGDAVHKTRERFKIKHPLLYRTIVLNVSDGRYC
jgi:hypothetical protein